MGKVARVIYVLTANDVSLIYKKLAEELDSEGKPIRLVMLEYPTWDTLPPNFQEAILVAARQVLFQEPGGQWVETFDDAIRVSIEYAIRDVITKRVATKKGERV